MRLTIYTDYALRLLMYLALKEEGLATIAEVAKAYGISKNHLMKVAYELGVAGDIETVRGRNGGLKLSRAVESIVIGDVVRRTEPDMAFVPCFSAANQSCAVRPSCVLRRALEKAGAAFLEVLDGYTLADLVRPNSRLKELLAIAPAARKPKTAAAALAG
jgi:Rrf2 family nitric oxide-sensitive transcriptional repressor